MNKDIDALVEDLEYAASLIEPDNPYLKDGVSVYTKAAQALKELQGELDSYKRLVSVRNEIDREGLDVVKQNIQLKAELEEAVEALVVCDYVLKICRSALKNSITTQEDASNIGDPTIKRIDECLDTAQAALQTSYDERKNTTGDTKVDTAVQKSNRLAASELKIQKEIVRKHKEVTNKDTEMVSVPVEPSHEMIWEGCESFRKHNGYSRYAQIKYAYKAMITAYGGSDEGQ